MKRKTKLTGILVGIMSLAGIGAWWTLYGDQCLEEGSRLVLPHSTWVIITQYSACGGAVGSGYTEVIARDLATQKQELLLHVGEIAHVRTAIASPSELVVALPNLSNPTEMKKRFADMDIAYRYTPHDDPEERANYQLWSKNPDDPRAHAWWCDRMNHAMHGEQLRLMRKSENCD